MAQFIFLYKQRGHFLQTWGLHVILRIETKKSLVKITDIMNKRC